MNMKTSSIIAVGDVHGCDAALEAMLKILMPRPERCVFLGDYVDRGPSSIRVVEQLLAAKAARPDWVFLAGNHELMLLESMSLGIAPIGENTAYSQYSANGGIPPNHQAFFDALLPYLESDHFLFVHGGIDRDPAVPAAEQMVEDLVWAYNIHPNWCGKKIVRGHAEGKKVVEGPNYISIDTGCWRGGYLTAVVLDDLVGTVVEVIQVQNSLA